LLKSNITLSQFPIKILNFKKEFILILITFSLNVFSQNQKNYIQQPQFWSELNIFDKWSKKWATQLDIQYARQGSPENMNLFKYQQQLTFRFWGNYYFWDKNQNKYRLSAFIGNWDNDEIRDLSIPRINEYRGALQLNIYTKKENPQFIHRIRTEYRMFEKKAGVPSEGFEDAVRLRYQTRFYKPINQSTMDSGAVYFVAFQEAFLYLYDRRERESLYDQNRIFLGFGYVFSPFFALEAGYFGMFQKYSKISFYEMNHIFSVSIFFDNIISSRFRGANSGLENVIR
jgi:hypothetical protein